MANGTEAVSEKFLGLGEGAFWIWELGGLLLDRGLILLLLGQDLHFVGFHMFLFNLKKNWRRHFAFVLVFTQKAGSEAIRAYLSQPTFYLT